MAKISLPNAKNRFRRLAFYALSLFALMFIVRLLYGFAYPNGSTSFVNFDIQQSSYFDNVQGLKRNYASERIKSYSPPNESAPPPPSTQMTQKYEKTANLESKTSEFDADEKILRGKIKSFEAIIQYENSTGKRGNRDLRVVIGVAPEKFDSFYIVAQKIGNIQSMSVSKTDKTNEYRNLNAQKLSLEKTLNNLNDLKKQGGGISDFVQLNDKILEIETKLQELGVQIGEFDTENEFCTIRFSLTESQKILSNISFWQRLKVAFEWTAKYYFLLMLGGVCGLTCVFLMLLILDKLNILKALVNKMEE